MIAIYVDDIFIIGESLKVVQYLKDVNTIIKNIHEIKFRGEIILTSKCYIFSR